jgi:hypothetical protein
MRGVVTGIAVFVVVVVVRIVDVIGIGDVVVARKT